MDYFISDTHFKHNRILHFERNQFETIEDHDYFILSQLKKKLTRKDILYHLGDFSLSRLSDDFKRAWSELPCRKVLIMGNHDTYNRVVDLFDEVHRQPVYYSSRVLLSHYPMPVTKGVLNIHGHVHNGYIKSPNYFNVNVEQVNYQPVSYKDILSNLISKLQKDDWSFGNEWFSEIVTPLNENYGKIVQEETKK